jgi:hypothetical protein
MSQKTIRSLLESRLKAWAAARVPALPIAFENASFTPPQGAYLAAYLLPADTTSQDLEGSLRNRAGVFQVNIVCPTGKGPAEGQTIAAELDALFPANLRLTSGPFVLQTTSPTRERSAIQSDDRYTVPVDFTYRSDST